MPMPESVTVGIEDIAFSTAGSVIDLSVIADAHGVPHDKFYVGIGQNQMSVAGPDEDPVTLAAAAVDEIKQRNDLTAVRTLLLATESGVDQSKSAGVFVHGLVGLHPNVRVLELKQACYSATGALMLARSLVTSDPSEKVLVVATDIAKYDIGSSGEPTQGAGAVAMLISTTPRILALDRPTGVYTDDVMDFWRPNHRKTALVDGKFSIEAYLRALSESWEDYSARGGRPYSELTTVCFHQPFTKMANKAHRHLAEINSSRQTGEEIATLLDPTQIYNRRIGNTYTASMYFSLISLLENSEKDLDGAHVGFFSYGSGSVGEFWSATIQPGYRNYISRENSVRKLDCRTEVGYLEYLDFHQHGLPENGSSAEVERKTSSGGFRLSGIDSDRRRYENFI